MKNQLLGVIDATAYYKDLDELIAHRSLAALPFAGRYRMIDFVLSNMTNSEITRVAIFPKMQYRSLMDHLGSGENWNLNRKRDGLFFLPIPVIDDSQHDEIGCFQYFAANLDFFYRSCQEYSLITGCNIVFNMNFKPLLNWHIDSGCDITEVLKDDGSSMEMYMIKTSLLIELIETRSKTGYTCLQDAIRDADLPYTVCQYRYNGYAARVDSIQSYYSASMDLLRPEIWKNLFVKEQPIFTKVKDEPPTRYIGGSSVQNSIIANGCLIRGSAEYSIVSSGVRIGKGSIIKNCVIMQKCQIGDNCYLDSIILDKDVKVAPNIQMIGTTLGPYVIRKGTVQGALMGS